MSRRPLRGLVASLVLHAVLVVAVLAALPRSELLPALFVDLTAANPSDERTGPAMTPVEASVEARRPPEPSAPSRSRSASAAMSEPPASPPATSEPTAPVPIAPSPLSTAPALPLPAPPPDDATASASPSPAPFAAAPAEPEPPSASAALNDDAGGAPLEPAPVPARGGSALGDPTAWDDAPHAGIAAAPDLRGVRPSQGDGAGRGAGTGQELARRSPASEGNETPQGAYTEYLARLRQRLHQALRYPPAARRRGLTGAVTIELTILPSGVIRDVSIVKSSAHPLLDEAAVETVRALRARPFPENVPRRTLRVRLPVVFQLE